MSFIPYETIQKGRPHPAVFPEKLPKFCLMLHGIRPDLVDYDPFIGAGTTASACINLDVKFVGTEIDEHYIRIARDNVSVSRQSVKVM